MTRENESTRRTAQSRHSIEAQRDVAQNESVCALVTDPRLGSANDRRAGTSTAGADVPVAAENARNPRGYQESERRDPRATQDGKAAENAALLHRARSAEEHNETDINRKPASPVGGRG